MRIEMHDLGSAKVLLIIVFGLAIQLTWGKEKDIIASTENKTGGQVWAEIEDKVGHSHKHFL